METTDLRSLPLHRLGLSSRVRNCLFSDGCRTLGDIADSDESSLLYLRNFGLKSLEEVRCCLATYGLALKSSRHDESVTLFQPGNVVFVFGANTYGVIIAIKFSAPSFPLYTVAWWLDRKRYVANLSTAEFKLHHKKEAK